MKDFFRHNGVLILIAAVLLALVTAVVSMLLGGTADPLSNLVGIVTTPVRNGISALAGWTEEQYADAFEREQLKSENAELKLRVAELEEQARAAEAALQENERLRADLIRCGIRMREHIKGTLEEVDTDISPLEWVDPTR